MTLASPGAVMGTLDEIERALAELQNEYEAAAHDRAVLARRWEKRLAQCRLTAEGNDADARKAAALIAAINEDSLYKDLAEAEGKFEGARAVMKVHETRALIGMAILKAQGRA